MSTTKVFRLEVADRNGEVEWIAPSAASAEHARRIAESKGYRVLKIIETNGACDDSAFARSTWRSGASSESAQSDGRTGVVLACLGWVFWPCLIGALYFAHRANAAQKGAGDAAKNIVYIGIVIAFLIGLLIARGYFSPSHGANIGAF